MKIEQTITMTLTQWNQFKAGLSERMRNHIKVLGEVKYKRVCEKLFVKHPETKKTVTAIRAYPDPFHVRSIIIVESELPNFIVAK